MKRLWLILFVIIGCVSNWKPVTLELKDGTVLKGEVRTTNSLHEEILFVTLDDKGMRIKIKDIEKSFVGKKEVPLERIEHTFHLTKPGPGIGWTTYKPKNDPNAPDGTELVLKMLEMYAEAHAGAGGGSTGAVGGSKGCHVYGKIKFVDFGENYKVKFVDFGENLKIKYVDFGESKVGHWNIVDFGENYKIKVVEFGEDYKIKVVQFGEDFSVKMVDFGEGCN